MKKTFILSFIVFVFIFYGLSMKNSKSFNNNPEQEVSKDFFESNFPLKKLSSPYFINDLSYNKVDNFLKHPFYDKFGITECYVHKDIYANMLALEGLLKKHNLKAVMFDCFRPHEAQIYMWNLNPNPKFLANPNKSGSLHSKGLAVDIGLADMNGKKLEFATGMDHFVEASSHSYKCKLEEQYKCDNRALLKSLMEQAGLRSIKNEWWHYQKKGDTSKYPLIRVCDTKGSVCYNNKE